MDPDISNAGATLRLAITLVLLALPNARAAAQSGTPGTASAHTTATVSGTVYDSLAGKPLAGALVQLIANGGKGKASSATTGVYGEFEFPNVPRGSYEVGFLHASLDSLGLGIPTRKIDVGDSATVHVSLAVPSGATIRNTLCSSSHANDSTGLVLGFIRDADSGEPLGGASMVVMWTELVVQNGIHTNRRLAPVKSNSEGWFALCGVPSGDPLTARAERGEDASGYIEITVPALGLLHRDFRIPTGSAAVAVSDTVDGVAGESVRRGSARLAGTVRNGQGRPLGGARLMVWGSGSSGSTQDDGTFSLSNLPAGTQSLEVRYVGYSPKRVIVELLSHQTVSTTVTLDQRVDELSAVTIYGKPSRRSLHLSDFLERRKMGFGHFFTRADIEKKQPFQLTDLFRGIPGFRVVADTGFGYSIVSTRGGSMGGGCRPRVYLDGMRLSSGEDLNSLVWPSDVVGVEAYSGASESPPQFTDGACGSILVWTGPDLGSAKP